MFNKASEIGYITVVAGIERKTMVHGDQTLMTKFRMKKGSTLPMHAHPHEQTGYLVSGRMQLRVGTESYDAQPGDAWCIPGQIEHGAQILEDSVAVEVFSPTREAYIPKDNSV